MWHVGSSSPTRDRTQAPLHWELRVLVTEPPGRSSHIPFLPGQPCPGSGRKWRGLPLKPDPPFFPRSLGHLPTPPPCQERCPAEVQPFHLPFHPPFRSPGHPLPGLALLASVTHIFPRTCFTFPQVAGAALLGACFWSLFLVTCGCLPRHLAESQAQRALGLSALGSAGQGGASSWLGFSGRAGAPLELCPQALGTAAPLLAALCPLFPCVCLSLVLSFKIK